MLKDLQDGVFLIRESDQRKGEYAVGLRYGMLIAYGTPDTSNHPMGLGGAIPPQTKILV